MGAGVTAGLAGRGGIRLGYLRSGPADGTVGPVPGNVVIGEGVSILGR
jgi:hypothetical protein